MTPMQQLVAEALRLAVERLPDLAGGEHQPLINAAHRYNANPTQPSYDRGTEASDELTEIRTTLSRAVTAREQIRRRRDGETYISARTTPDPDQQRMLNALDEVIAILIPYQRTGATSRSLRGDRL